MNHCSGATTQLLECPGGLRFIDPSRTSKEINTGRATNHQCPKFSTSLNYQTNCYGLYQIIKCLNYGFRKLKK